ncbi:MAG: hypothetical protein H6585_00965 [Flavobacteriales bacterium]|nr:hypothetical protein [Flavobacteriales bacterium]MCB9446897.1 hypothetical protein [Flavobacteriales bacterium]
MRNKDNPEVDSLGNKDILGLLLRWKVQLLVVAALAIALSTLFSSSLFIEPKYKSFAVIYPANISTFGSESEVEQSIQVLRSDDIAEQMIKAFELVKRYKIDPDNPAVKSMVRKEYGSNVSISKTEFESINIEVYDREPEKSLEMCNKIIDLYNKKIASLRREKMEEVVNTIREEMNKKSAEKDTLEHRMRELRMQYGLLDYGVQTQEVLRGYYRALSQRGASAETTEMRKMIDNLKEKGGEFVELSERAWRARTEYLDLKNQLENAEKEAYRKQTYANVVTRPVLPDKKAYPVRWLIVMVSTLASLFLAILVIAWLESYQQEKAS